MLKKQDILFGTVGAVLLLAVLGTFLFVFFGREEKKTPPEPAAGISRIRVENGNLVNADGDPVQLTGMSSHGLLWYPEYTNAHAMQTLKQHGANTFRVAVYSDDPGGGYVQRREDTMRLTYMAIENAVSAEMYVIVDWHVLQDENPLTNLESAVTFFEEISSRCADCPNVLYEICNEPNGGTTWDDIYAYAEKVIPVIRNHAPEAVILVGTPSYSYSVESVFDRPLPYDNVMYTFHFYAGQHDSYYNRLFDRCRQEGLPIFVSEWGVNYGQNGKAAISQAKSFVTVLNRRGISWIAWSLCNKDEVFSAIRPDCEKLADWDEEDLTEAGKIFFDAFS